MSESLFLALLLASAGQHAERREEGLAEAHEREAASATAGTGAEMDDEETPEPPEPSAGNAGGTASGPGVPYVEEIGGVQSLHFSDCAVQSEMSLEHPNLLLSDYTHAMMGFLLFNEAPVQIEMIGLGGGSLAKYCYHALPSARITVAEISPEVIALRERFRIPADDERFSVICCDGADFVRQHPGRPDILLIDGFDRQGQPPQLCSPGFYDYCYERLAAGGVMAVNLYGSDGKSGVFASRIRDSFQDQIIVIPCEQRSNKVVFACKSAHFPPSRHALLETAKRCEPRHPFSMIAIAQRILHRLEQRKPRRNEHWHEID